MIGCSGAQINLSVKPAIQFPANDCLERDIAELQSKTWKLGRKGVAGAKSGRKAYEVVAVLHPMEPGSTAGDPIGAVSRPTKRAPAENRRTAMNLSWPLLAAALQWGLRRSANECRTKEGA